MRATLVVMMMVCLWTVAWPSAAAAPPTDARPAATPAVKVDDQAEVRRSLKLMRLWVQAQDFVPLDRFVHAQDEPGQKFIQAASDYARAVAGLVDPVRQRFGETGVDHMRLKFPTEAEAARMMAEMCDRSYAMIDALTVTIHNDEATVGDGDPKHETLKLHKIDGVWKRSFDVDSFLGVNGWNASDIKKITEAYTKTTHDLETLRKDIAAGKFQTVDEAVAARRTIERQVYPNW